MNVTEYKNSKFNDVDYLNVAISDLVFDDEYFKIHNNENYGDILITDTLRNSICKYVGMNQSVDKGLYFTDKDLWYKVLSNLYTYYSKESLILTLYDSGSGHCVKGICTSSRTPLSTKKFIDGVLSYYEDSKEISVYEVKFLKEETVSEVILMLNDYKYEDFAGNSFKLGIVFRNDELSNCYCRMVIIYENNVIYYLPSKYYNLTTSRYEKTTSDSKEALDILLLRVSDDNSSGYFHSRSDELIFHVNSSRSKNLTLMEYEQFRNLIQNILITSEISESEGVEILNTFELFINDFEKLYGTAKNDYLWKCTAIGSFTLYDLFKTVNSIVKEHVFYPQDDILLRELLGEYLVTPRICQLLAKKL